MDDISKIIAVLNAAIPLVTGTSSASKVVLVLGDAYQVYADVQGHKGLEVVSADAKKLFTDLGAAGINLGQLVPDATKISATVHNYASGGLAVLANNFRQLGADSPGKVYAVKDGGDAADIIDKVFYQGYSLVPPA